MSEVGTRARTATYGSSTVHVEPSSAWGKQRISSSTASSSSFQFRGLAQEDANVFLTKFESIIQAAGWDNETTLRHFANTLVDGAQSDFWTKLNRATREQWTLVRAAFCNFYIRDEAPSFGHLRQLELKYEAGVHILNVNLIAAGGLESVVLLLSLSERNAASVVDILLRFADDLDARMRRQAVGLLASFQKTYKALLFESYKPVCALLNDTDASVRYASLELVAAFAQIYPENLVTGPHEDVQLRLVDDVFAKFCGCMHDIIPEVRREAAVLLGDLTNVSEKFLEQTLDKKLLPKMKFVRNARGRDNQVLSEWATGRRFGADAPVEQAEEDAASLIPSGACGAFIMGLEDEHMVVREASVDAVCKLALRSQKFADLCLDFMADMFNDEIEEVRLRAIKCLRQICELITLKEEQMETILNALDDFSADSREAVRELLGVCSLSTIECLRMAVDALKSNLKRYPNDKASIFRCMKYLGLHHSSLVLALTPDYLRVHPFLQTTEPDIEQADYMAVLILVLNAASRCPVIKAVFPGHTWRHYEYLQHTLADLVPNLSPIKNSKNLDDTDIERIETTKQVADLLAATKERLAVCVSLAGRTKIAVFELLLRDLATLCELKSAVQADSEFLRYWVESEVKLERLWLRGVGRSDERPSEFDVDDILQVLKTTYQLEYLFHNFANADAEKLARKAAWHLRVRAACLMAVVCPSTFGLFAKLLASAVKVDPTSRFYTELLAGCQQEHDRARVILDAFEHVEICVPFSVPAPLASHQALTVKCSTDGARTAPTATMTKFTAEIVEPSTEAELTVRFTAGLVVATDLVANFSQCANEMLARVRIQVTYPDKRVELLRPRATHFKEISAELTRLRTQVLFSHAAWTEACSVEIKLVFTIADELLTVVDAPQVDRDGRNDVERVRSALSAIPFSNAVSIKLLPKTRC